jgi:hypothetical protein
MILNELGGRIGSGKIVHKKTSELQTTRRPSCGGLFRKWLI